MTLKPVALLAALAVMTGCATTPKTPKVDVEKPKTVIGSESNVRVNASFSAADLRPNASVLITYEVQNLRDSAIALADLLPDSSYDEETQTITVDIGSEVPGNDLVPRLTKINSGETKSFTTTARMRGIVGVVTGTRPAPRYLKMNLHFLSDVEPFKALVDIPEKAVHDPKLADQLFPEWVEHTETVVTNAVPIEWQREMDQQTPPPVGRRGRRGGGM